MGFSQTNYVADEGDGLVLLALNLSHISVIDITVSVVNNASESTTIGEI